MEHLLHFPKSSEKTSWASVICLRSSYLNVILFVCFFPKEASKLIFLIHTMPLCEWSQQILYLDAKNQHFLCFCFILPSFNMEKLNSKLTLDKSNISFYHDHGQKEYLRPPIPINWTKKKGENFCEEQISSK